MIKIVTHQDFLDWYQPIHAPFVRFCSSKAIGWLETEDLVQEAILATLQGFYRIEHKDKLLEFMIGVVKNIIGKHHRRAKFKSKRPSGHLVKRKGNSKFMLLPKRSP